MADPFELVAVEFEVWYRAVEIEALLGLGPWSAWGVDD